MEDQEAWVHTRRRKTQGWEEEEHPARVLWKDSDEEGIGRDEKEDLSSEMDQGVD